MYCPNCGKETNEDASYCSYCGKSLKNTSNINTNNENKTIFGIVFALFLNLIGLIIGLCIYPENTTARETFLKGWTITFIISFVISFVVSIIVLIANPQLIGLI